MAERVNRVESVPGQLELPLGPCDCRACSAGHPLECEYDLERLRTAKQEDE